METAVITDLIVLRRHDPHPVPLVRVVPGDLGGHAEGPVVVPAPLVVALLAAVAGHGVVDV